jgi:hypothetical protein
MDCGRERMRFRRSLARSFHGPQLPRRQSRLLRRIGDPELLDPCLDRCLLIVGCLHGPEYAGAGVPVSREISQTNMVPGFLVPGFFWTGFFAMPELCWNQM